MAKKWWLLGSKQLHPLVKSVFSGIMSGYFSPIHRHTCWPCQHFWAVYWNRNCRLALVLDDEKIINLYEIDIRERKLEFPIHSLSISLFLFPSSPFCTFFRYQMTLLPQISFSFCLLFFFPLVLWCQMVVMPSVGGKVLLEMKWEYRSTANVLKRQVH